LKKLTIRKKTKKKTSRMSKLKQLNFGPQEKEEKAPSE
jgi:hypothetical protein